MLQDGKKLPVFWEERQEQSGTDWVRVEIDAPWQSEPAFWSGRTSEIVEVVRERTAAREQRVEQGWIDNGYVDVNGRHVLAVEKRFADKARAMVQANEQPKVPEAGNSDGPSSALDPDKPIAGSPRKGQWARWAACGGLLAIGVLLAALVARTLVLTSNR